MLWPRVVIHYRGWRHCIDPMDQVTIERPGWDGLELEVGGDFLIAAAAALMTLAEVVAQRLPASAPAATNGHAPRASWRVQGPPDPAEQAVLRAMRRSRRRGSS